VSCSAAALALCRQWTQVDTLLGTIRCTIWPLFRVVGERIAELLHETNENWVQCRDDDGCSLHVAFRDGNIQMYRTLLSLYPEVRVMDNSGFLIHYLRIRNRPTRRSPQKGHQQHQALGVCLAPSQPTFLPRFSNNDIIYNATVRTRAGRAAALRLRLSACSPLPPHCALNYPPGARCL
jgi:hypothetical protein